MTNAPIFSFPQTSGKPAKGVMRNYFFRYLSDKGVLNLPSFAYSGSDQSLVYQHLLSPALNRALEADWVPRWLHPNTITVSGLLLMVAAHALTACYCPSFSEPAPWWVFAFNAFALFAYWVLDALDGKQARKTGTASPLGLLMDHGCDAANTTVGLLNLAAAVRLGTGFWTFVAHAVPCAVFFCATWEEFYVGALNLPIINGPNEGILLGIAFQLISAVFGNEWWTEETAGVPRNILLLYVLTATGAVTIASNIYNVGAALYSMQRGDTKHRFTSSQLEAGTIWIALTRLVPMVALLTLSGLWTHYSPTDIFSRHPRLFLWVQGLMLCKLVMTLMVAHLSDDSYHPFGKTTAITLTLFVHNFMVFSYAGMTAQSEDLVLYECAAVVMVSYVHMVVSLVREISTLLDINVFTIPKAREL